MSLEHDWNDALERIKFINLKMKEKFGLLVIRIKISMFISMQ